METTRITRVRIIKNDKDGKPINLTILDLANGKTPIVRNEKQFLTDLEDSGLIPSTVRSIRDPKVQQLKTYLVGGIVSGDFVYRKAGDKWTVTKDSRVITDSNHPNFGKVSIGDEQIAEKDRTIVDGFLFLSRAEKYEQMFINADAKLNAELSDLGAFDTITTANTIDTSDIDPDNLPDDILVNAGVEPETKGKGKGK